MRKIERGKMEWTARRLQGALGTKCCGALSVCVCVRRNTVYRRLRLKGATDRIKAVLLIRCMGAMKGYRESESERNVRIIRSKKVKVGA